MKIAFIENCTGPEAWAADDFAWWAKRLGHSVKVAHAGPEQEMISTVSQFRPELIVGMNILRKDMPGRLKSFGCSILTAAITAAPEFAYPAPFNANDFVCCYTSIARHVPTSNRLDCQFPVNPAKFRNGARLKQRTIFFASSKGGDEIPKPRVRDLLIEAMGRNLLIEAINLLESIADRPMPFCHFEGFLARFPVGMEILAHPQKELILVGLYWHCLDPMYRKSILRKLLKMGWKLRLAGEGWDKNPEFKAYAYGGVAVHGAPLAFEYSKSKYSLHLNINGNGDHHRLAEILCSGGMPLLIDNTPSSPQEAFNRSNYVDATASVMESLFGLKQPKQDDLNCVTRLARLAKAWNI